MHHLFIRHTSASLTIQENADPSARRDLENWLARLVPESDPLYTHTDEGPDDMPSHIKAVLTSTSIGIPLVGDRLGLGRWQGIYLWEHRRHANTRRDCPRWGIVEFNPTIILTISNIQIHLCGYHFVKAAYGAAG